jgi:hypothetical protein
MRIQTFALAAALSVSAASLTSEPPEGEPISPANAQEAYALAMNPKMKDSEYVHKLAVWLASYGQRPDWAAAAEKRAVDLRAEQLLGQGLVVSAPESLVEQYRSTLQPTHPRYAAVLAQRISVAHGGSVPASYALQLDSGGTLAIDMSIFRPASSGYASTSQSQAPTMPTVVAPAPVAAPVSVAPVSVAPKPPPVVSQSSGTVVQLPQNASPLATQELQPATDPYGTLALCRVLIDEQGKSGWKHESEEVKAWQKRVGMAKPDGKFGTGSALRMAQETVVLPWVRYFSLGIGDGSKTAALNDFRQRLRSYALSIQGKDPNHAARLLVAADAETGQGWPTKPSPAPAKPVDPAVIALMLDNLRNGKVRA